MAPLRFEAARLYERARMEREVGVLLGRLPADWTVLHSVPLEDSVVPHLLVGPAGVFVLFPHPEASVRVPAGLRPVDLLRTLTPAEASAARVRERLAAVLRPAVPVVPVLALPARDRALLPPPGAVVLAFDEVVPWLRSLPEVCSAVLVDRIADAAAIPATWVSGGGSVLETADGAGLEAELAEAERRWRRTIRAVVAGSLGLLVGASAAGGALVGALLGG